MYKRSKRFIPAKRQRVAPRGPRSTSRALIRLDTEKLRKKALAALQKAESAFEDADRSLKNFENAELRAFERWKYLTLGPTFAELHRLMEQVQEAEYHLAMAEDEHWRTGQPLWKCFERWKAAEAERRLHPSQPPPEAGPEERSGRKGGLFDDEDDDDFFDDIFADDDIDLTDDEIREIIRETPMGDIAKQLGIDVDSMNSEELRTFFRDGPSPDTRRAGGPARKAQEKGDLRSHYRQLCRLLHPDAAGELTAEKSALWHQVQDAYAERDEVRLGNLLARVQQMIGLDVLPRTLAELKAAADHFRQARERLRVALRDAAHHPAWKFSVRSEVERNRMAHSIRYELEEESRRLKARLTYIHQLLAPRPKSAPGNRAKPQGRRRRPPRDDLNLDFLF